MCHSKTYMINTSRAECCILTQWSMLFTLTLSGFHAAADRWALALSRTNTGPHTAGDVFPDIINSIKSAWHLNVTSIHWLRGMGNLEEEWDFKILLRWAGLELLGWGWKTPRTPPPPMWCFLAKTHRYSQQISWWPASPRRGLWVWSRWVCSCGGPSRPPPGRDRRHTPPQ